MVKKKIAGEKATYKARGAGRVVDPYPVLAVVREKVLAAILVETTAGRTHLRWPN